MPFVSRSEFVQFVDTPWVFLLFFFCLTLTTSCVLRYTFTEKDNVLTWTKANEKKKIFILSGGKIAKKKKKAKDRDRVYD